MPFVNIKLAGEAPTAEQKQELIARTTQMLVDVLGKNPANTVVIIENVSTDDWGVGGESVTIRNRKKS